MLLLPFDWHILPFNSHPSYLTHRSYESYFLAMSKKLWAIQKLSNEFVATGLHPTKFGEIVDVVMPSLSYAYPGKFI